ncbi:bZIP transcription factor bZIP-1 [Penicillium sp. IBT 35674x]|nr:bZIP transcription factor bZIP-1 [Penicillium sp. IBT 35674x]
MAEVKPPTQPGVPRKRGRPRTNHSDDHEVPEKRRKQLREAQQTYRRRKETTINNLQTRVQELESGIEELSQSFLSFSNLLLGESILNGRPRITSALQAITQQCVSLARKGAADAEAELRQTVVPDKDGGSGNSAQSTPAKEILLDFEAEVVREVPIPYSGISTPSSLTALTQWGKMSLPHTPPPQDPMLPFGFFPRNPAPAPSLPSPPLSWSPDSPSQEAQLSLSHRIVRECCRNGYQLLVYSPNDPKVEEVFGGLLTEAERMNHVSGFYDAMHDDLGDMVDARTKVLSPMHPKKHSFSHTQLARSTKTWELVFQGNEEWIDACGVQRLLLERGIDVQSGDRISSTVFRVKNSALLFDVANFIRLLSMECVCVGKGPAFRRTMVEKILLSSTSSNPWTYDTSFQVVSGFNF